MVALPNVQYDPNNPPDFITNTTSYRPDIGMASAALNQTLNREMPPHGSEEMLYDPSIKRSMPEGWEKLVSRDGVNQFANKLVNETVAQLKGDINRAVTTSTGFQPYVLEKPAYFIFPVETPFLARTPRMVGAGTDIEHWKSVLSMFFYGGVNAGPFGQTNLGGTTDGGTSLQGPVYNLQNYQSSYQTIAQYNSVTFQSQWRSRALEGDLLARMKANLIYTLKLQEENWLLNGAVKLWAPAKPLLTAATTGGNITGSPTTFWIQITAVNGNGESLPSTAASVVLGSTSTGAITINFSGVINATSYNVYIGTGSTQPTNSNMFIGVAADFSPANVPTQPTDYIGSMAVSTILVTKPTTGANPPVANTATVSQNLFDGVQSLCYLNPNTGANPSVGEQGMTSVIVQPAAGTGLLAIQDFQFLFRKMYSQARADPSVVFVSPVEAVTLDNLVGTSSNFRILAEKQSAGEIASVTAGVKVRYILNQVTGREVEVCTLPFLPQGTVIALSYSLPFPAPDITDPPFRVMVNQDYTAVDYPPTQANPTTWGFGYFVDETLVSQYQGGIGILTGIQPPVGV